jgi:hypothetical protein
VTDKPEVEELEKASDFSIISYTPDPQNRRSSQT